MHRAFIKRTHPIRASVHFGADRTLQLLSNFAFWIGIKRHVKSFCRGCFKCQQSKIVRPNRVGLRTAGIHEMEELWSNVHIDHYGPLNRTKCPGNLRKILSVICANARSPKFLPVSNDDAQTTAKALLSLFCQEAFPRRLMSDRGPAFASRVIGAMAEELEMSLAMAVSNRPQANGLVESPHRLPRAQRRKDRLEKNYDSNLAGVPFLRAPGSG